MPFLEGCECSQVVEDSQQVPSVDHILEIVQEAQEDKLVDSQSKVVVVVEDSRLQVVQAEEDGIQRLVDLEDSAQSACMVEHWPP